MTFLAPSMLLGLSAASIPVIVHLLHRRRARRVTWGAMQFLGPSPMPATRTRNVAQWVLMALRMTAIALLVLALAHPRVSARGLPAAWAEGEPVDIAMVID